MFCFPFVFLRDFSPIPSTPTNEFCEKSTLDKLPPPSKSSVPPSLFELMFKLERQSGRRFRFSTEFFDRSMVERFWQEERSGVWPFNILLDAVRV